MQKGKLEDLKIILFEGTQEEHRQALESLEELMRAIQERRSNAGKRDEKYEA